MYVANAKQKGSLTFGEDDKFLQECEFKGIAPFLPKFIQIEKAYQ